MAVLTKNQTMLAGYLAAVGCSKGTVFSIIGELWDEEAVIEMLEFCRDNPDASQVELLEMSSRIYLKYKERIDAVPDWTDEEEE